MSTEMVGSDEGAPLSLQRCPRCTRHRPQGSYAPAAWGSIGKYCRPCAASYQRSTRAQRIADGRGQRTGTTDLSAKELAELRWYVRCPVCDTPPTEQADGSYAIVHDHEKGCYL